ncbi:MAG: 4Fe-4S dicluster domain-containing protein [Armatimonadota bacterium]|nr:4Fe-4S dicluster domain-containing protein [bacterium]MCS7309438.1 4Fe-4S dicluster domain-containing protein [Armatimonadota bacterium]MDW8290662.1 4Fe-4S dicluster domain-containing protein [Armatimonadota bacterium]
MERQIRYQREADLAWAHSFPQNPGCERLLSCIQCGTCSATCPLALYMDLTPRQVIALVREGFREDVLRSKTIWLCASCYACAVECPQNISITDVMYRLKREAIASGIYPKRFPIPVLAREFYEMVRRRGRNSEFWVVFWMAMRTNPLVLLSMARTGWELWRTGRMSLRLRGIQRRGDLQYLPAASKEVD